MNTACVYEGGCTAIHTNECLCTKAKYEKKVAELEAELSHLKQVISQDGICGSEHFKKDYNYKLTTL